MFISLMADLIGIDAEPHRVIELARRHGYKGVDLRLDRLDTYFTRHDPDDLRAMMRDATLCPGYCSILPGKIAVDEQAWAQGIEQLPRLARLAEQLGYRRTYSVILPFHETLDYEANFDQHVRRMQQILPILDDHGIRVALEYVSPVTRRRGQPHEFLHDMDGLLTLCEAIGSPHVGLLLDSFHWHCAGETDRDITRLLGERVVVVHTNDLIAGRSVDEQVVTERALPGETGVIDLSAFYEVLREIDYDGPITSEPTHPKWKSADDEDAARQNAQAMRASMGEAAKARA